jgi:hypothetical protein
MNSHSFEKLLQQDAPPPPDAAARRAARQAALAGIRARAHRCGQCARRLALVTVPSFVRDPASLLAHTEE